MTAGMAVTSTGVGRGLKVTALLLLPGFPLPGQLIFISRLAVIILSKSGGHAPPPPNALYRRSFWWDCFHRPTPSPCCDRANAVAVTQVGAEGVGTLEDLCVWGDLFLPDRRENAPGAVEVEAAQPLLLLSVGGPGLAAVHRGVTSHRFH